MSTTPLSDRINARKPQQEPEPVKRMSPWLRRLAEKRLPVQDRTATIYHDGCGPDGTAA